MAFSIRQISKPGGGNEQVALPDYRTEHRTLSSNYDAKVAALLTHVSIMIALVAYFLSEAKGNVVLSKLIFAELCGYILIAICCLLCLLATIAQPMNTSVPNDDFIDEERSPSAHRAFVRARKARALLLFCIVATIVLTIMLVVTVAGKVVVGGI